MASKYKRPATSILELLTVSLLILLLTSCTLTNNTQKSTLSSNTSKDEIHLSKNGKSKVIILLSADASIEEIAATAELKKYLDKITGANFTVRKENGKLACSYISVGNTAQSQKAGFSNLPAILGNEGIAVKSHDGNIFLLAGPNGIMNATMAFLEDDLGCRWYSDQWNFIPKDKNLKVKVANRVSIPDFNSRFIFTATAMSSDPDWTRRNRVMKWNRFNHVKNWFCHTYEQICPMSEFKTNKDLFAKRANGKPFNTQICPTHPEIVKRAKTRVLKALRSNKSKEASLVAIAENDGSTGYCHCPRCEKINKKHGSPIAAHLYLVNNVARAIKDKFPNFKVDYIVYSKDLRKPPTGIKMEPNTAMWFCSNNVGVNKCYRDDAKAVEEFAKWKKIANKFYIWEYGCDYSDYFRVTPSLHAKIDNLKFWKENGAKGIMFLEVFGARGGDQQALRAWILSKMLWDSTLDPDKLALDFCKGVFGDAAPEMYEYYQLVKKAGVAEKSVEEYYGKAKFIDKANRIFAKAFAKADKAENIELHNRIDVHYAPIAFMEIKSIFQAYPSNKDSFPTKRYKKLLKDIKIITKREKMGGYSEVRKMAGYIDELESLEKVQKNGALWIYAINGTLYKYPVRKDPLAANGKAPLLPCDDNWLVQWAFPSNLCVPGLKYQLKAQLRPVKNSNSIHVATGGVHFKPGKTKAIQTGDDFKSINRRTKAMSDKKSFTDHIDGAQLSNKEYRWVDIGKPFIPEKDSYIWFAASSGTNIKGLFVDKIELHPVGNTKK